jgi:hypothetical protein
MTSIYVTTMIAMLRKPPSTLATSSLDASKRLTEGPFIVTEVISPSTYRLQWGDGQGVPNPWNVEHLRRFYPKISFFSSYVFSPFVFLFFILNKKYFKQSSATSRALPPPSSYYNPPPLDMLGGLAKANIWVARPGDSNSSSSLPLDMLGGLAKANLKVIRPKDIIANEYEAP